MNIGAKVAGFTGVFCAGMKTHIRYIEGEKHVVTYKSV